MPETSETETLGESGGRYPRGLTRREALARLGLAGAGIALGGAYAGSAEALASLDAERTALRWNLPLQPTSLDIATNNAAPTNLVGSLINEPLVQFDARGQLMPWLAEAWTQLSPIRYVFKLRKGARFSDGSALTSEDVAYSFARNLDPKLGSQIGYTFTNVRSIRATGPHEVAFTLKAPDITFLESTPIATYILKKSFAKPLGTNYARPGGKMVGTGPFLLQSYTPSGITIVRNPHYWGQRPTVDRIEFSYIVDPEAQLLAFRNGSIDGAFGISAQDAGRYATIPGVSLRGDLALSWWVAMKGHAKPWNDIHFRRAVAHCWNGSGFVKGVLQGQGQVVPGLVYPAQWRLLLTPAELKALYKTVPSYPFTIDAARTELRKSSVPNGFTGSINYPARQVTLGLALQALAANLKQIGITLNVNAVPANQWLAELYGHSTDLTAEGYAGPDFPDPIDMLLNMYASKNAGANGYNVAEYRSSTMDRLIKTAGESTSTAVRKRALEQALRLSMRDLPYVPLFVERSYVATRAPFGYKGYSTLWYYTPWIYHVTVK